jgi:hypothetical protein
MLSATTSKSHNAPSLRPFAFTVLAALSLLLGHAPSARGQQLTSPGSEQATAAPPAPAPTVEDPSAVEKLRARIEALEARLQEMEANQAKSAAASSAVAAPEAPSEERRLPVEPSEASDEAEATTPTLQIRGFGDLLFRASDQKGDAPSFALGDLDLFITSRLSEKLSVLSELVFEPKDGEIKLDLERLQLQYAHNDYLNLSVGRYHTSIGYYNTTFHHGKWFETAVDRPFIFDFEDEGGPLPTHNVGATVSGRIPSGRLGLRYGVEIGNGRLQRSPVEEPHDNDEPAPESAYGKGSRAANLVLIARPDGAPGLQMGVSFYHDRLQADGLPTIGESIWAAHLVYQTSKVELLNEAVAIRHTLRGSDKVYTTPGFYTQFSRQFGKYRPYFRYQYINAPESEPFFADVGRRNGPSLGLRYDFNDFAAFKAQYDRKARRRQSAAQELTLQLAFTF